MYDPKTDTVTGTVGRPAKILGRTQQKAKGVRNEK